MEGVPATENTEVRVLFDEANLYIGVSCYDSDPQRIIATQMSRDADLSVDDRIESIWKPFSLLPVYDFPGTLPSRLYLFWSNSFPKNIQDTLCLRLKINGLLDQLLMVDKEKWRLDKSKELADEIAALEATVSARSSAAAK